MTTHTIHASVRWAAAAVLLLTFCNGVATVGAESGKTAAPSAVPLAISWKGDIKAPVKLKQAPDLEFKWAKPATLKTVVYVAKATADRNGKMETKIMSGRKEYDVSETSGVISGQDWSLGFELSLAMWGARGKGSIEIAFFEPLAEGETKDLSDRRQISNWLSLPIDLGY